MDLFVAPGRHGLRDSSREAIFAWGLQMEDITRGLDVLRQRGLLDGGRALGFGRGLAAVALLHAAAIDARIAGVAIEDSLVFFRSIAEAPIHRGIFQAVIPNVHRQRSTVPAK